MQDLPEHPGVIEFVDHISGRTRRDDARYVPDSIKFARDSEGQLRPVVLVRMTGIGNYREIEQIAADGTRLVRTTGHL
jgi:hypothetical protein